MSSNPLIELIRRGESGAAGYNAYNRGTYIGSDGKEHIRPADRSIDFSQLTLGQVQALQYLGRGDSERLFAVGKYQIIPETMDGGVRSLKLDPNQRFTPELQDKIFSEHLIVGKRPAIHDYIVGKLGVSLHAAQKGLAMEWASFGDPDKGGKSHYGGANKASITLAQSAEALNQMRAEYKASIDKGMSPQDAWRAVTSAQTQTQDQTQAPQTQDKLQTQSHSKQADAGAYGIYRQGEKGDDIRGLQTTLILLGYRDANGNILKEDGDFGKHTKEAVEAFQRSNGLKVDGIVGPDTLESLGKQSAGQWKVTAPGESLQSIAPISKPEQTVLLSNPSHPDHALYRQALVGIEKLPPNSFQNDQERRNAAATLSFEAKVSGLKQIDHVVLSTNGAGLFAVQGRMDDPAHHRIYLDRAQAAAQPMEQSTQQIEQETQRQQTQYQQQASSQSQTQTPRAMFL